VLFEPSSKQSSQKVAPHMSQGLQNWGKHVLQKPLSQAVNPPIAKSLAGEPSSVGISWMVRLRLWSLFFPLFHFLPAVRIMYALFLLFRHFFQFTVVLVPFPHAAINIHYLGINAVEIGPALVTELHGLLTF